MIVGPPSKRIEVIPILANSVSMYLGSRKQDFKKLIEKLLKIGDMNINSIENLLDEHSMKIYGQIFTQGFNS